MKPFKVRAKEAKRRWDSEAGLLRDAETLRLIVKHRLNVLWHEGYHRWCWIVSQDDTPMGCASSSKSIHTAVRRATLEGPVSPSKTIRI